jgi:protein SCO1/2
MQRFFLLLLFFMVMACSESQHADTNFFGTDISETQFDRHWSLPDHQGHERNLDDFLGKVVIVFFGYSHCPDVCPTTMADFAKVMKMLGDRSDEVQVVFVTLDPERDTQSLLQNYVNSFDKRFVALRGSQEQIKKVAKNYKVFYEKQAELDSLSYSIDHSAGSYVFDKKGKVRIYLKYGQKPPEIVSDLKQIL